MTRLKACLLLVLIIVPIMVSGCAGSSETPLSQDKYVAIQENLNVNCTLIDSENYTPLPHITPPYEYDYRGFAIRGDGYYPEANDSLKILYGTKYYRVRAPWDTVTGLRIRGVYGTPYVCESGFVLDSVDGDGTISGRYDNTTIVLRVDEQWISPARTETKEANGTSFIDSKPYWYIARFDTTWTITSLGLFDKSNLTRSNSSKTAMGFDSVF